jgi:hypothetical protein
MTANDATIANRLGGFRFTRGTYFFAGGVVAEPGLEIVRARLERPLPWASALDRVQRYLAARARPMQALCGIELRAPIPYSSRQLFAAFNAEYVDALRRLDLLVDGLVPMTRANLATDDGSVDEQCLYAFHYTVPSDGKRRTFGTSAQADLKHLSGAAIELVAEGDTSPDGLTEKLRFVTGRIDRQLIDLGASWSLATHIGVYAVHPIGPQIADVICPTAGSARHGITWHLVRPPVVGLDVELDVRAVLQELVVDL